MWYNQRTRITTSIMGVLLAMAGSINHGIFEIMQGSRPTPGLFIEAIGESHRFWVHGTEGAVTLIPNFLLTGITVLIVSLALIIWSVKYIDRPRGPAVFLLLMILMTLTGGGLGHLVFFLPVWGYATRIHSPLRWWRKVLVPGIRKSAAKLWPVLVVLTALSWLMVMELGIFGRFPGQNDPEAILNICFAFVLLTVFLANLTYISAFAHDMG